VHDRKHVLSDVILILKNRVPFIWPCPSMSSGTIGCCSVAKCGFFRTRFICQIGIQGLKWPFPENRVLLFGEMLSVRHPEEGNGG
jgi:hypothetical protein